MSNISHMPLFVDDFEAATAHLTFEEDGAYNRLLRLCWRQPDCSVPDDDAWLKRKLRCDDALFERAVKPVVDEFFTRANGRLFQKRQRKEFEFVKQSIAKRKSAGKKGGLSKSLKNKKMKPSNATILLDENSSNAVAPTPTPTPTPIEEVKKEDLRLPKKETGTRIPDDFLPNETCTATAKKLGISPEQSQREFDKFLDYWRSVPGAKGRKLDWQATFRVWLNNSQTHSRGSKNAIRSFTEIIDDIRDDWRSEGGKKDDKLFDR